MKKDYQQDQVYDWENKNLDLGFELSFDQIQDYVNFIWSDFGLKHPPKVQKFANARTRKTNPIKIDQKPKKKYYYTISELVGEANRFTIKFQEHKKTAQLHILHETAHSMNDSFEHHGGDHHGPNFVGLYMQLVERYMGVSASHMHQTAQKCGIKFNKAAKPLCGT